MSFIPKSLIKNDDGFLDVQEDNIEFWVKFGIETYNLEYCHVSIYNIFFRIYGRQKTSFIDTFFKQITHIKYEFENLICAHEGYKSGGDYVPQTWMAMTHWGQNKMQNIYEKLGLSYTKYVEPKKPNRHIINFSPSGRISKKKNPNYRNITLEEKEYILEFIERIKIYSNYLKENLDKFHSINMNYSRCEPTNIKKEICKFRKNTIKRLEKISKMVNEAPICE
jgi:hypothetical protein